jgi:acetyl-CoA/propionyl-CoA carboxylase biotin carboxyl carrier protein
MQLPAGPGVRVDFGYAVGDRIPPYYDSMIGKIIVSGRDRPDTLVRAQRALREFRVEGLTTIAPLHQAILSAPEFCARTAESFRVHTRWIDTELERLAEAAKSFVKSVAAAKTEPSDTASIGLPASSTGEPEQALYRAGVKAPLSGVIMELCVKEGDSIRQGDIVAIMEAMKMEQPVMADVAGVVAKINVGQGSFIEMDADIMGVN